MLRQRVWALGRQVHEDGSADMEWYAADGQPMGDRWGARRPRSTQALYDGAWLGQRTVLLSLNGSSLTSR